MGGTRGLGSSWALWKQALTPPGAAVKVYNREKTLADCFKFRNRIGMDIVLEALRFCLQRCRLDVAAPLGHARACRVERVMWSYLQASL